MLTAALLALTLHADSAIASFANGIPRRIVNAATGQCLTVMNAAHVEGAHLQLDVCRGEDHQKWLLEYASGGYYRIRSVASELCIDLNGDIAVDGTAIWTWSCHGLPNQLWLFESIGDTGQYRMHVKSNGKCLDTVLGRPTHQWSCHDGGQQLYEVIDEL